MIDKHWNETAFNLEKAYVQLTKLNMFFFLRIEAITDLRNTSKTIIKIGPPYKTKENIVNLGEFNIPFQKREFAYSFQRRQRSENIVPSEAPKKKIMDAKLVKKYSAIIKELNDHSGGSPSLESDYKFWGEQLDDIYNLQANLENSAQPILPMENYQINYDKYLYNMSRIHHLLGLDLKLIVEEMFGSDVAQNIANSEQKFFVPDIKYLTKFGEFLNLTEKRYCYWAHGQFLFP